MFANDWKIICEVYLTCNGSFTHTDTEKSVEFKNQFESNSLPKSIGMHWYLLSFGVGLESVRLDRKLVVNEFRCDIRWRFGNS